MKKKIPDRNKAHALPYPLPEEGEKFLKNFESENQMLDDFGRTIVGRRDRQPNLEEDSRVAEYR